MSDAPASPPRWIPVITVILSIIGTATILIGLMFTMGGWRAQVDGRLAELDRRVGITEDTQRRNLPSFYQLQRDVAYLAERARDQERRNDEFRGGERRR